MLRHPYEGEMKCQEARDYLQSVKNRQEQEAQTLARLTGWNINQIRRKIDFVEIKSSPWWRRVW